MPNKKPSRARESNNAFFLKLVIFLIVGSFWLKITKNNAQIPIPLGMFVGIIYSRRETSFIDKKIEYAILLIAALVGFWAPIGLYINL